MRRTVQRPVKSAVTPIVIHRPEVSVIPASESAALDVAIAALDASVDDVVQVAISNEPVMSGQHPAKHIEFAQFATVLDPLLQIRQYARQPEVTENFPSNTPVLTASAVLVTTDELAPSQALDTIYTLFAHRSGHETFWACPRRYYLNYLHCGTGIVKQPTKLQLAVGTAVHIGLGTLLLLCKENGQVSITDHIIAAVYDAINNFRRSSTWLFMKVDEQSEQLTLITALLFSFYFHRWPTFSKQFEILTVERDYVDTLVSDSTRLVVSSRPDAIVRDRRTNEIAVISWKTADNVADYKRVNYHQNLQVFLEGHYGEKVLARYLDEEYEPLIPQGLRGKALMQFMSEQSSAFMKLPREVTYTQTIFLVKGARTAKALDGTDINLEDADSWQDQDKVYKQQSFLCYKWVNLETGQESWSYRHWIAANKGYNNLKGDWAQVPVTDKWSLVDTAEGNNDAIWEIAAWVQKLSEGQVFPSTADDPRNEIDPLKRVVVEDEPEEHDAVKAQFHRDSFVRESSKIALQALRVHNIDHPADPISESAKTQILADAFPMHLTACNNAAPQSGVPVRCEYKSMCLGTEGLVQLLPGEKNVGPWVRRIPHHEVELNAFKEDGKV